jgi:hypothetical protein
VRTLRLSFLAALFGFIEYIIHEERLSGEHPAKMSRRIYNRNFDVSGTNLPVWLVRIHRPLLGSAITWWQQRIFVIVVEFMLKGGI